MDHPRSRGVYDELHPEDLRPGGSSPLARGLRHPRNLRTRLARIIPARAGFTGPAPPLSFCGEDHPRSRGVYWVWVARRAAAAGSSPLARGLRCSSSSCTGGARIIPARAGFTNHSQKGNRNEEDHPRSRGVYRVLAHYLRNIPGSSPLARGLPRPGQISAPPSRIIPARAGFTTGTRARRRR